MSMAKRLIKEIHSINESPNPAVESLGPIADDDLSKWQAVLIGVAGTPYENGRWLLNITVPPNYPIDPPSIYFKTPIFHPNIHFSTGEVCLDVLKSQWSPAWTLSSCMTAVQALLSDPEPDSPLNVDAANLLRAKDVEAYNGLVRYHMVEEERSRAVHGL